MTAAQENTNRLTVQGEMIEGIYRGNLDNKYYVNRRYQRKLVWTLDEKVKFIDSILNGYPIPLILLAESSQGHPTYYEIIDGMQRLNAIVSYIENDFAVNGLYFDLNTMASSKLRLDNGILSQKEPVLERTACVKLASYTVPLSIYEFSAENTIDEVFRRINSGGKKLSRQELRISSSTGHFSQAVRKISCSIRGDVAYAEELPLSSMKSISITNRDLDYGIDVDSIFWVANNVLTKEDVRESKDEELVADILSYVVSDVKPASRSEYLDDYFDFGQGAASDARYAQIEMAIQRFTVENIESDFARVLDFAKQLLTESEMTFRQLLFIEENPARLPRYFQVVFLSLHTLIISQNMECINTTGLLSVMRNSGGEISIPEGGRWGAEQRTNAINSYIGRIQPFFQPAQHYDPAQVRWITQFENILNQSYTEQAAYDFKQGFLNIDTGQFDEQSFQKILKTLSGIANIQRNLKGYVIVGVADTPVAAAAIRQRFGLSATVHVNWHITGISHEATSMGRTLDQLFQSIVEKIRQSPLSEGLKSYIASNVKLIKYYDKSVFIFESKAQAEPSTYDGKYYVRVGNALAEILPAQYADLFRRFL